MEIIGSVGDGFKAGAGGVDKDVACIVFDVACTVFLHGAATLGFKNGSIKLFASRILHWL